VTWASRFWTYQRERFPLATHGLVVLVLAAGGIGFSLLARGETWSAAALRPALVAFGVALGAFFQLRVADEYKDFADDLRFRPYRPVPRGLVALHELAYLALAAGGVQIALTVWLRLSLLWFLGAIWLYMALMRWEFFVHDWLRAHPIPYLLSHMVITPLIVLFITACDWHIAGSGWPPALGWFLAAAYANGVVFEIGRKVRAPEDEETGVETYTMLWGPRTAAAVWSAAVIGAGICAAVALWRVAAPRVALLAVGFLVVLAAVALATAIQFARSPVRRRAKRIERFSALWMLLLYVAFALMPFYG
jgi:4-hydroxybenzoate polyprenyltransferase